MLVSLSMMRHNFPPFSFIIFCSKANDLLLVVNHKATAAHIGQLRLFTIYFYNSAPPLVYAFILFWYSKQ